MLAAEAAKTTATTANYTIMTNKIIIAFTSN